MKYMIGYNIKNYIEINQLTLRECSKKFKVNHVMLSNFIRNKKNSARLESVCRIADSMNVSLDDLLFSNIYENVKSA